MRPERDPAKRRQMMLELVRACEPEFVAALQRWQTNRPDPVKNPANYALVEALIRRLEIVLSVMRGDVDKAVSGHEENPNTMLEIEELESWVSGKNTTAEGAKHIAANKGAVGNWLSGVGFVYTDIVSMLEKATKGRRGAPPALRPKTLAAYDLRLHEQLSYSKLAAKVCSCGKKRHDKKCQDSLRHRFKELEKVLSKYGFHVLGSEKEP